MGVLDEISDSVKGIATDLDGSIVGVGHRWASGSGIVTAEGQVVTNAHNVRGEDVAVGFTDGRTASGTVTGIDPDVDLAVLAVDTGSAKALEFADPSSLSIGSPVFAAANPGGQGLRVTFGLVSGVQRSFRGPRGRTIRGAVEHTAPLLPGSSGGALLDASGRVLGINTNRLGEGFYLAIPADEALRGQLEGLSRGEAPSRPRLGVGIAPSHVARGLRRAVGLPDAEGLLVRHVEEDTPAATAGLAEGDLIVEVAGRAIAGVDELYEVLESAGDQFDIKLLRGTEDRQVTVQLAGVTR
jgi:serine protease Do